MNNNRCGWMAVMASAAGLLLAACGGNGDSDGIFAVQTPSGCGASVPSGSAGAGSAAAHAQVQRSDGSVDISRDGSQFVAKKLVTIANDFGAATAAEVTLGTQNGAVTACANTGGGYGTRVMLEARATSEAEARRGLDSLTVNHMDSLAAGTLRLNTTVQFGALSTSPIPGMGSSTDIQRVASIVAGLPATASYAITPSSSNGAVQVAGLSGTTADVSTSTGAVTLDGRWNTATLDNSNGIVSVAGDYASLQAKGGNGLVEGDLTVTRNLTARFSGTNGSVDVRLRPGSAGYDLTGSTNNGSVSIDVANTVAVGEQTRTAAHRRSSDYASRSVQASIGASTNNGGVSIHQ